jgi:hypothetical protein
MGKLFLLIFLTAGGYAGGSQKNGYSIPTPNIKRANDLRSKNQLCSYARYAGHSRA